MQGNSWRLGRLLRRALGGGFGLQISLLESSLRALGGSLSCLGGSWRALGVSWAVLQASWEVLGLSHGSWRQGASSTSIFNQLISLFNIMFNQFLIAPRTPPSPVRGRDGEIIRHLRIEEVENLGYQSALEGILQKLEAWEAPPESSWRRLGLSKTQLWKPCSQNTVPRGSNID